LSFRLGVRAAKAMAGYDAMRFEAEHTHAMSDANLIQD
jgi:hypothetical protein